MSGHPVLAVLAGKVRTFSEREDSAIAKTPLEGPVAIGPTGLAGDEQADRVHHGGREKALHHYPADHYPAWRAELGDHPLLAAPGGFGENIATTGLVESEVCIGDRFRLGTALVEVSQGRQPCWKLDHHFQRPGVLARVVSTRHSGWYYRVLESGQVVAGDTIALVDRPLPEWSVARCFDLLVAGDGKHDPAALRVLAAMPQMAEPWRIRARELLG